MRKYFGYPIFMHTIEPGQRFGDLVVTETDLRVGKAGNRAARVRCECGNERVVRIAALTGGYSRSCGHARRNPLRANPLYVTWDNMIRRCENPAHRSYPLYGGRGIAVTARWHDPAVFMADIERWLGPRPPGMSLDRIMNDHDYRLDNVRWASRATQGTNNRQVKLTPVTVLEIRARYARGGVSQQVMAGQYGVSQRTISSVVTRRTWKHVALCRAGGGTRHVIAGSGLR